MGKQNTDAPKEISLDIGSIVPNFPSLDPTPNLETSHLHHHQTFRLRLVIAIRFPIYAIISHLFFQVLMRLTALRKALNPVAQAMRYLLFIADLHNFNKYHVILNKILHTLTNHRNHL